MMFQVRTVLENPTRYHVIQKQKSQVRQYLSESFQPQTQVVYHISLILYVISHRYLYLFMFSLFTIDL